jgi:hypothetical protein
MTLSLAEIGAIVIGLGGGFWLMNRILEGKNAPDLTAEDFGARPTTGSGGGERPADGPGLNTPRAGPWWEVLGVPQIATRQEISQAYKRKISETTRTKSPS